jgi:hypothetical protein
MTMSTRISVRSSSFIAAEDQIRRLSVMSGEVASVELGSMVAQPQPAPAAMPVWCGTLPGLMAGKRPAPKAAPGAMPIWYGTLPGVMAGKRPARSYPAQSGDVPLSGRAA